MSQKERILEYLKQGNTLTHLECEDMFNCSRIAARIDDLKKEGEPVDSRMIKISSGKHVAQYYYIGSVDMSGVKTDVKKRTLSGIKFTVPISGDLYPDRMPHHTDVL